MKWFVLGSRFWVFQFMVGRSHCFWACGKVVPHGKSAWQGKLFNSWLGIYLRQRKKRGWDSPTRSKGMSPMAHRPPNRSLFLKIPSLPQYQAEDQAFNPQAFGGIPDPSCSKLCCWQLCPHPRYVLLSFLARNKHIMAYLVAFLILILFSNPPTMTLKFSNSLHSKFCNYNQ